MTTDPSQNCSTTTVRTMIPPSNNAASPVGLKPAGRRLGVGMRGSATIAPAMMPPPSTNAAFPIGFKPVGRQVAVGMACAAYWRGAWYVLDDHLYPESTISSAVASLGLGTVGLAFCQGFAGVTTTRRFGPVARFGALYAVATSCVLVWRGAWLLCDVAYEEAAEYYLSLSKEPVRSYFSWSKEPVRCDSLSSEEPLPYPTHRALTKYGSFPSSLDIPNPTHRRLTIVSDEDESSHDHIRATDPHHRTISGLLSHGLAIAGLLCVGRFASVLAPPARHAIVKDAPLYAKTAAEYQKAANWLFQTTTK